MWDWAVQVWDWLVRQFNITFVIGDRYMMFVTGMGYTLVIALGAAVIGVVFGAIVAMVRVYHAQTGKLKPLNAVLGGYLAFFRGTPIVVQLMLMYFIILSFMNNALLTAVIAFGINSGAYVAEIFRAGILSVDSGQTEAGRSLGLSALTTLLRIVLPQAVRNILPALGNEFVTLLKETSVASYITVFDFARAGERVRTLSGEPYFSLIFAALVYFLLVFGVSKLLKKAERRLARSDRG